MPLKFYSTEFKPGRSQADIQRLLLSIGARRISHEYSEPEGREMRRRVVGISFELETPRGIREFILPARVDAVRMTLERQGVLIRSRPMEHAESVAWRTLLGWLELQAALIETDQAKPDEIMLPYMLVEGHQTLYDQFRKALPAGVPA